MAWKPNMMIYHAHCADGFGAAWAAWMRWGDAVEYVPCGYGQEPPDVAGKDVLIGDFSFKQEITAEYFGAAAKSVVILDHHKTAEAELFGWRRFSGKPERFTLTTITAMVADLQKEDFPAICALFDMERSGARMVWDFCHPGQEAPLLIKLIEDRDLWRFTMPETKPFGVWLRCEPMDFERWEEISQELMDVRDADRLFAEANAMQRFFDAKVSEIAALARTGRVGDYDVPLCNCPPMFASEVGHKLLADNPEAPFVACYSDQGKARGYSLRSQDSRQDVSEIARKFGGGGHRNAAGFGVPLA